MTRLLLPCTLLLAVACDAEEPLVCTDDLRYGIDLNVIDEGGVPIDGSVVTYSVDGEPTEDCPGSEGQHVCGPELAGTYELTVDADGYETATVIQDVSADECHVIPEVLEVTLIELATTSSR